MEAVVLREDAVACLVRQVRRQYDISGQATYEDLARVCAERGLKVARIPRITGRAYYVNCSVPFIVLREDCGALELAHELYHSLVHENATQGVFYNYHGILGADPEEEKDANRFAELLCGTLE